MLSSEDTTSRCALVYLRHNGYHTIPSHEFVMTARGALPNLQCAENYGFIRDEDLYWFKNGESMDGCKAMAADNDGLRVVVFCLREGNNSYIRVFQDTGAQLIAADVKYAIALEPLLAACRNGIEWMRVKNYE